MQYKFKDQIDDDEVIMMIIAAAVCLWLFL